MSTTMIISIFAVAVSVAFMIGVTMQCIKISTKDKIIEFLKEDALKAKVDLSFAQEEVKILKELVKKHNPEVKPSDASDDSSWLTKEVIEAQLIEIHDKLQKAGWSSFFFAAETEFGEAKHIPLIKDVAYTKEGYEDEYRQVLGAMILETFNEPKLGVFHDVLLKQVKL